MHAASNPPHHSLLKSERKTCMSWLKSTTWASLAGLSLATAPAQTLTLTLDSVTPAVALEGFAGGSVFRAYAGLLNFTVTAAAGTGHEPLDQLALYCVELQQHIALRSTGNVYSLIDAAGASSGVHAGYSTGIPLAGIGPARVRSLEMLYGHVFGPGYHPRALTGTQKSAFQLAVWELSHDDGFTLTSGTGNQFWVTSTGDAPAQAQGWVDWVAAHYHQADTPLMSLSALHNPDTQDFLIPTAGSFSAIPEPPTFGLLAGCAALALTAWRRKKMAAPSPDTAR
jgi:hypothetical protein